MGLIVHTNNDLPCRYWGQQVLSVCNLTSSVVRLRKQNDKLVSRVDSPQTTSPGQKLQSIAIDVKDTIGERQYKITCFVRSGLIQAQGNHYHEFVIKDCHALLSTMHHLSAPYLSEGHILQQLALVNSYGLYLLSW
jgi:hypothetical protein